MHISQTQPQNGDQKVLRVISMKEQLCKPQGKCTWNTSISFCVVTLYLHKYNREEAGHCTEKFFLSQIDVKSTALDPAREG